MILLTALVLVLHSISSTAQEEATQGQDEGKLYSVLMPDVHPLDQPIQRDTYLCTGFRMPQDDYKYIVEFTPNTSIQSENHMLLYGCELPGKMDEDNPRTVWACGGDSSPTSGFPKDPVCASGSQIIYSWSKGVSTFTLPEGVAFKVGKGTGINYLVLKLYYREVGKFSNGGTDDSGFTLRVLPSTTNRITKKAGIYLISADGVIRAGENELFEAACKIDQPVEMHPFAFRPHAHALGKAVSGYKIDKSGNWILIGKGNPQKPMKFYFVKDKNIVIDEGDIVASRCTMYNYRDRDTYVGPSDDDEMCMFYMMYYEDFDKPLAQKGCDSAGPPTYYWSEDPKLPPIPSYIDKQASDPSW